MITVWDTRFLKLAEEIASYSKDKSTKVGCVIVGKDREVRTTGYNGLPRGANDDIEARQVRPEKLFWFEHAERNAIYNAARVGIPLEGSTAYTTLCPCMDCSRSFIQSGIKRVVTNSVDKVKYSLLWEEQFIRSEVLFKECGVELVFNNV